MRTTTRLLTLGTLAVAVMGVHACDKVRGAEPDAPF